MFTESELRRITDIESLVIKGMHVRRTIGRVSHRETGTYDTSWEERVEDDRIDGTYHYETRYGTGSTTFSVVHDQIGKDLKDYAGGVGSRRTVGELLNRVYNWINRETGEPWYSSSDLGKATGYIRTMVEKASESGYEAENLRNFRLALRKYNAIWQNNCDNPNPTKKDCCVM